MERGFSDPTGSRPVSHLPRVQHAHPRLRDNPVRAGILCLPVSAVLLIAGAFVRGPFRSPAFTSDARAFSRWVTSPAYSVGWLILIAGTALLLFGVLSLTVDLAHGRGRARALFGLCTTVAGIALSLAMTGSFAFGWPSVGERIAGDKGAFSALATSYSSGPLLIAVFASSALCIAGALVIGMVIWESRTLPRWAGLLYMIHAPLLCNAATMTLVVEQLGAFFLLLCGVGLASGVRHEEEVVRHLEHHAPAD